MTFVDTTDPLADMTVFDNSIDAMAGAAKRDDNLNTLQLALDALISTPTQIVAFRGDGYPFSQEQFLTLLTYCCQRIWPSMLVSGPGEAVPVEFVFISCAEWALETKH